MVVVDKATLENIFKRLDANGDGKISASELTDALKNVESVTVEEIQQRMAEIDADGDGFISFEEFTNFANAHPVLMENIAKMFN